MIWICKYYSELVKDWLRKKNYINRLGKLFYYFKNMFSHIAACDLRVDPNDWEWLTPVSSTLYISSFTCLTFKLDPKHNIQSATFALSNAPCQFNGSSRQPFSPKWTIVSLRWAPHSKHCRPVWCRRRRVLSVTSKSRKNNLSGSHSVQTWSDNYNMKFLAKHN